MDHLGCIRLPPYNVKCVGVETIIFKFRYQIFNTCSTSFLRKFYRCYSNFNEVLTDCKMAYFGKRKKKWSFCWDSVYSNNTYFYIQQEKRAGNILYHNFLPSPAELEFKYNVLLEGNISNCQNCQNIV